MPDDGRLPPPPRTNVFLLNPLPPPYKLPPASVSITLPAVGGLLVVLTLSGVYVPPTSRAAVRRGQRRTITAGQRVAAGTDRPISIRNRRGCHAPLDADFTSLSRRRRYPGTHRPPRCAAAHSPTCAVQHTDGSIQTGYAASRIRRVLRGPGRLGNMRHSSESRDHPLNRPDNFSSTLGRVGSSDIAEVRSTGWSGPGNFRSPSRDATKDLRVRSPANARDGDLDGARQSGQYEPLIVARTDVEAVPHEPNSAGGGPQVHSGGRGGAGSIIPGPAPRTSAPAIQNLHRAASRTFPPPHDQPSQTGVAVQKNVPQPRAHIGVGEP